MDQLLFLMIEHQWINYLVTGIVIFRLTFKPLFTILSKYVELTVNEDDDKKLHKFMQSKTYKMLSFIADLIASVKLPTVKKK